MPIHGLTEKRRLPRLGKIRLGVLVHVPGKKPYPRATDHFIVPDIVAQALGVAKPTELPIMFPLDDPALLFPQDLKAYRTAGLFCSGDGVKAHRWHEGELKERDCPCELLDTGECKPSATLNLMLPDVPGIGVWQVTTSNKRSITSLNSGLEMFHGLFGGLAGIPFLLKLEPQETQRYDERTRQMVKTTIQVLRLDAPLTPRQIIEWRGKAGKPVAALMPATLSDDDDRVEIIEGGDADTRSQVEQVMTTPGSTSPHGAGSAPGPDRREGVGTTDGLSIGEVPSSAGPPSGLQKPGLSRREEAGITDGRSTAPPLGAPWDLPQCFTAAGALGVDSTTYGQYLQGVYGVAPADLPDRAVHEQEDFLIQAGTSPSAQQAAATAMRTVAKRFAEGKIAGPRR